MKICTNCNKEKSVSEFYFKKNRNSYESSCKKCRQLSVKNYLEKNNNLKKIFYTRVRNILKRSNVVDIDLRNYLIQLWEEQEGKCYYTGIKMSLKGYSKNEKTAMTVDRIDPNGGYTRGNIVLCCSIVNKIKQNLSINELLEWCNLIKISSEYRIMEAKAIL